MTTDRALTDALIRAADHLTQRPLDARAMKLAGELRALAAEREGERADLVEFLARTAGEPESDHLEDDAALLVYIGGDDLHEAWGLRWRWYA